jgi:purine-binding chemotaxis protein CheW
MNGFAEPGVALSGMEVAGPPPQRGPAVPAESTIVVFRLQHAAFGVPIAEVREVLRVPPITRVPFAPPGIAGVVALRGRILSVLDLSERLFSEPSASAGALLVVAPGDSEPIGLLVDEVPGVFDTAGATHHDAPPEALAPLPPGWLGAVIEMEPGRLVTMLNIDAITRIDGGPSEGEPRPENEPIEETE